MKRTSTTLAVILLAFMFGSCGKSGQESPQQQQSSSPSTRSPAAAARNVSAIKACDLVKGDEVIKLAGATKLQVPPAELAIGEPQGCVYLVLMPGGDSEYFHVSFIPADHASPLLSMMTAEEKGEKVDGPWDEAWYGPYPLGTGKRLFALRSGDYGLEVRNSAGRKEPIVEIARLAVSRVK